MLCAQIVNDNAKYYRNNVIIGISDDKKNECVILEERHFIYLLRSRNIYHNISIKKGHN